MKEKTVKVRYLARVYFPERLAGKKKDTRDLPEADAERLAAEGYVEIVPAGKGKTNE